MHAHTLLTSLFAASLAIAAPTPLISRSSTTTSNSFTVTQFTASVTSDNSSSSLSFTFTDPRPSLTLTTTCKSVNMPKSASGAPGIYSDNFATCDVGTDVQFRYMNDGGWIEIERASDAGGLYMVASAAQGTYWKAGVNVTQDTDKTTWERTDAWTFPITSMSAVG